MSILEKLNGYILEVQDIKLAVENRIEALKKIQAYINQLKNVSPFENAIVANLLSSLKAEYVSDFVVHCMAEELRKAFYIPDRCEKVAIIAGENWISDAMKEVLEQKYFYCIPYDKVDWNLVNDYKAAFFVCENREEINNLLKERNIGNAYIINVCALLDVEFLSSPSLMNIFNEFEEACEKEDVEALITGLSYGRDAVHCDLLDKPTATLANSGQDLYYDYLCLQYAYSKVQSLRYIISVVAPFSLRYDESFYKHHSQDVLFYYGFFEDIHHNIDLLERVELYIQERNKINDVVGDWKEIAGKIYKKYYLPRYGKEYFSRKDVFMPDKDNLLEIEADVRKLYKKPYEKTLAEYKNVLKQYCNFAEERNIKILFIIPPFTQVYKHNWDENYYGELMDYLQQMKEMFHVDYMDMTQMQLPDTCFRDSGHINRIGAIYIADKVNEWLKKGKRE